MRVPSIGMRSPAAWTRPLLVVLALFAALGQGCVSKPTMKLNHAEFRGVNIAFPPSVEVLMTLYVDVYNPNSYDVAVRAVRGQVLLANKYMLPVDFRTQGDGVWLASDKISQVAVPINVPAQIGLALLAESFTTPEIPFQLGGRADVTASRTLRLEKDDYSINEQGTVSRRQLESAFRGGL